MKRIHLSLISTELRVEKVFCHKNNRLTNHDKNRRENRIDEVKNKEVKGKKSRHIYNIKYLQKSSAQTMYYSISS